MTVADSPAFTVPPAPAFWPEFLQTGSGRYRSPDRPSASTDGRRNDTRETLPELPRWPRVFPGL